MEIVLKKDKIPKEKMAAFVSAIERLEFIHDEIATLCDEAMMIRNEYPDAIWDYKDYTVPERI